MIRRVAITGGLGAGKSLVAAWLRQAGHAVVDADVEGRAVVEDSAPLRAQLASDFGADLLLGDGGLDRRLLARRAFATPQALAGLNARVFPYLEARLEMRLKAEAASLAGESGRGVFLDAALVYEWGIQGRFDEVWMVRAPDELRLRRAAARLGISLDEARLRLERQWPQEEKARLAHEVLDNDGNLDKLRARLCSLLQRRGLRLPPQA